MITNFKDIRFKISSGFQSIQNAVDQIIVEGTYKDEKSNNMTCGIIMDQQKYNKLKGENFRVNPDTCESYLQNFGINGSEVRYLFRADDFEMVR